MFKNSNQKELLLTKSLNGTRLSFEEGLFLYQNLGLLELGMLANTIRQKKIDNSNPITFVIDRNINYTNICSCECNFCAFYRSADSLEGYVLTIEQINNKIEELVSINGTQILLQGGLNKAIPLSYYVDLLRNIKNKYPSITIHAFSPPEISFIAKNNNLSTEKLLLILKEAGLDSIPGGGAEILSNEVRKNLSPNKISSEKWLDIMEVAHKNDFKTSATMMAGSIESDEDIIKHLTLLRELQDKTNSFIAFIPWTFQSTNTKITPKRVFTVYDYLKLVSISRIMLDNFRNIQVSWPTQGFNIAQIALNFGANDFGGTMLEENVLSSTGLKIQPSIKKIILSIHALKRTPAQRKTDYTIIKTFTEQYVEEHINLG